MKDLTQGSVVRHLVQMAAFMAVSMLTQTLYLLADLYWVGRLGREAIAAVGVAGNLTMIVMALTQTLGVGTTALLAQAAGRKDQPDAERTFNQSLVMSLLFGLGFVAVGFLLRDAYCDALSADVATAALAKQYLNWFIPGLALQFPLVTLGSALRATGIIKPAVGFQVLSVILNMGLAPLFIFGVGPLRRMGVSGAALATFISILVADVLMVLYFHRKYQYLRFRAALWRPQIAVWWAMLKVGVPAGAEFALWTLYAMLVYTIIRPFGAAAQAGFGVGMRVMQAMFLPVVALSFAVAPVVGQNFGGRHADRVRHAVYAALGMASALMLVLTVATWLAAPAMMRPFTGDAEVGRIWCGVSDDRVAEFPGLGDCLQQFERLPGPREYDPTALEHGVAAVVLCAAGGVAIAPGGFLHPAGVVSLGSVSALAGVPDSLAPAAGAGAQATVCGGRSGMLMCSSKLP